MNKTCREGVNVKVIFALNVKQARRKQNKFRGIHWTEKTAKLVNVRALKKAKRTFQPAAQLIYRLFRPIVRLMLRCIRKVYRHFSQKSSGIAFRSVPKGLVSRITISTREWIWNRCYSCEHLSAAFYSLRTYLTEDLRQNTSKNKKNETENGRVVDWFKKIFSPIGRLLFRRHGLMSAESSAADSDHSQNNSISVQAAPDFLICSPPNLVARNALIREIETEKGVWCLIQTLLQPGSVFVDIGAGFGLYTIAAAQVVDNIGLVAAFEPSKEMAERLQANVSLNEVGDRVQIYRQVISNKPAKQKLSRINVRNFLKPQSEIPVVCLDEYAGQYPKIDLIKIGKKSNAIGVLTGARGLIGRNPELGIIVQLKLAQLEKNGYTWDSWMAQFENLGMVYKLIDPQTGLISLVSFEELVQQEMVAILFARPGAPLWSVIRAT